MKKIVRERALIERINRRIGGYDARTSTVWGNRLHVERYYPGGYENPNLGRYYTVDQYQNSVQRTHIDLERYGREVGALAGDETVTFD